MGGVEWEREGSGMKIWGKASPLTADDIDVREWLERSGWPPARVERDGRGVRRVEILMGAGIVHSTSTADRPPDQLADPLPTA
jgi:hypothetical protein